MTQMRLRRGRAEPSGFGYERLLAERIIFLGSQVDDENANGSAPRCCCSPPRTPRRTSTSTSTRPGGSITAGMAIYDTMQYIKPNDVATFAMGMAASMGQFLLCAGTKGKRYAMPHARIMMHQPSGGIGGTASDIRIQAEQFLHIKKQMAELIAEHTGQPVEQIETRLRPRPLVHRRGGPGVRLRRPGRHACARVAGRRPARRERQRREPTSERPSACTVSALHPARSSRSAPSYGFKRHDPYTKLFEDRIIFLGVQVDDASANDVMAQLLVLESHGPRPRHLHLHQLPRRLVHRADGDLRHDAVHQAAHPDGLPGPGRLGGRRAAGRRHARASGSRCRTRGC